MKQHSIDLLKSWLGTQGENAGGVMCGFKFRGNKIYFPKGKVFLTDNDFGKNKLVGIQKKLKA